MHIEYLTTLRSERDRLLSRATTLVDTAEAEGRSLTASEAADFDRLTAEIEAKTTLVRKLTESEERASATDRLRSDRGMVSTFSDSRMVTMDQYTLSNAFAEARSGRTAVFDSHVTPGLLEARTMTTVGGSAVPTTFADFITVYQRNLSPVLQYATVLTVADGRPITLPRLTADPNTGGTVTAEGGSITAVDPTLSAVTLDPVAYKSIQTWSSELDLDAIGGLQAVIAESVARDLSLSYGQHLTTGGGTTVPWGYVTRASVAGTAQGTAIGAGGASYVSWTDMADLMTSVAAPYQTNGVFMVAPSLFTAMLKWRGSDGQPILATGTSGVPATLFGRPVVQDVGLATLGSASKSAAFGDFSKYIVAMVTPTRVETSRDAYFSSDIVALKTVVRLDGDLVDTAAVKVLVSSAT